MIALCRILNYFSCICKHLLYWTGKYRNCNIFKKKEKKFTPDSQTGCIAMKGAQISRFQTFVAMLNWTSSSIHMSVFHNENPHRRISRAGDFISFFFSHFNFTFRNHSTVREWEAYKWRNEKPRLVFFSCLCLSLHHLSFHETTTNPTKKNTATTTTRIYFFFPWWIFLFVFSSPDEYHFHFIYRSERLCREHSPYVERGWVFVHKRGWRMRNEMNCSYNVRVVARREKRNKKK